MKRIMLLTTLLVPVLAMNAQAQEVPKEKMTKIVPKYESESPLPKGWPTPGPYDLVSEKKFPAYRAAYTNGSWQNFAFMRLFKHIQRKDIPMTSPVEMDMEENSEKLKMKSMAFMYQNTEVGQTGKDGAKVEVRDVPSTKTLCFTWQGSNSTKNRKTAKAALETELKKRGIKGADYRILGYNGPGVPNAKKTWEMLVVLPKKK
ncbi:MAG: hypothetical protein ACI9E1_000888 [Cryomorphaceae bacterium]|jgi:hypothetical protein